MTELSLTKSLSLSHGAVNISVQHNKKFQCAVVHVIFHTSQRYLLTALLQKYVAEKCLITGVNMNNSIYSALPGESSIILFVPENKITNNVSLLCSWLAKSHLTSQQARMCGNGDYSKLAEDLKTFEVNITGKCKTFRESLRTNATKITNMVAQLNAITPKPRDSFNNGTPSFESVPFNGRSKNAKLYASIALGDIPAIVKDGEITFLSPDGKCKFAEHLRMKDTLQAKVKSFLTQTGAVGSPAANDKGGEKFKAKSKYILTCQNSIAEMFSELRGFKFSFSNVDDLRKVDSDALAAVKAIKFT